MNLHITWPIEDPDAPISQLRDEAKADLAQTLRDHNLTSCGRPRYSITHGKHPSLHVRLKVSGGTCG